MQSSDATLPEDGRTSSTDGHAPARKNGTPQLNKVETELPDGRYLLVYGHPEPKPADA